MAAAGIRNAMVRMEAYNINFQNGKMKIQFV